MKRIFFILSFLTLFVSSCSTLKPLESSRTDSVFIERIRYLHDSIYLHKSDTVRIETKGDTVFVEKTMWRTEFRDRIFNDTITDTETVTEYKTEYVARMNGTQNFFYRLGIMFLVLIVLVIACWCFKKFVLKR